MADTIAFLIERDHLAKEVAHLTIERDDLREIANAKIAQTIETVMELNAAHAENDQLRAELAEARRDAEKLKEFARWAISEGPFEGGDLDGGSVQEKAEALGLIVKTAYDPAIHGETNSYAELGDPWYLFSAALASEKEKA